MISITGYRDLRETRVSHLGSGESWQVRVIFVQGYMLRRGNFSSAEDALLWGSYTPLGLPIGVLAEQLGISAALLVAMWKKGEVAATVTREVVTVLQAEIIRLAREQPWTSFQNTRQLDALLLDKLVP